jgi:hypothetical protein
MSARPKPTPSIWFCKIKRVNPRLPLRVHSAVYPRLTEVAAVNRRRTFRALSEAL